MPSELLLGTLSALTVGAYFIARALFLRSRQHPLLHPVFFSAALLIPLLLAAGISFEDYRPAKDLLTWPLGAATVALALPVYARRAQLRSAFLPLLCGVVAGSLAAIGASLALAALGGIDTPVLNALAVKSVTAAIAVDLVRLRDGDPGLAAAFVVMTGTVGAMLGPRVLSWVRVTHPVARGVALGTVSHAQGTAAALGEHELSGAMGSLALFGAALVTSLFAPLYIPFLLRLLGHGG